MANPNKDKTPDKGKEKEEDQVTTGQSPAQNLAQSAIPGESTVPYVEPVTQVVQVPEAHEPAAPAQITGAMPSKSLSAEQEAGRNALERKHSPQAKENERNRGKK